MDHTKKRFGKKDAVFLGLLLIIAILIFFFTNYYQKETGAMVTVTVTVDGKVYGNYDLEKEQTIDIKAGDKTTNILKISDGKAKMLTADCPDQLCVHQQAISKESQTIVCLPNKVVVEVEDVEEAQFDTQTN